MGANQRSIIDLTTELLEGGIHTFDDIQRGAASLPALPGAYACWFREGCLPTVPVEPCPHRDGYTLLYAGISAANRKSKTTLCDRILYCHVRGRATNSILRASLGLLLENQLGTAPTRIPPNNWGFERPAEEALSDWLAHNAAVSWVIVDELQDRLALERHLVESCKLPLNRQGNKKHPFCATLNALYRAADARTGTSSKLAASIITPESMTLKVRRIGNSLGILLPQDTLSALKVGEGDELFEVRTPDGIQLTPYNPHFVNVMEIGRRHLRRNRDAMRELARR
jgi:putative addiction module antidote